MLTLRLVCPLCGAERSVKPRTGRSRPHRLPVIERWDCQECGAAHLCLGKLVIRYPESLMRACRRLVYAAFFASISGGLLYLILSSFLVNSEKGFIILLSLLWGIIFVLARGLLGR